MAPLRSVFLFALIFTLVHNSNDSPGGQFSIADLHLAGWLTRVVKLVGGTKDDNGETVVMKLEEYIGGGFVIPRDFPADQVRSESGKQTKIGAFWDTIRERPGWKKVYADGLY